MSQDRGTEGESLKSAGLAHRPDLWPLPRDRYLSFVIARKVRFGWDEDHIKIQNDSSWGSRTLHEFPLSEEGWTSAWQTMASDYPQLAARVSAQLATARAAARERDLVLRADAEGKRKSLSAYAELPDCTLLGGYGWDEPTFVPGTSCTLMFTEEGLWVRPASGWSVLVQSPYKDAVALEFSGPGRVTTSLGVWGGGLGLKGAAEGMIVASVLNALTTQTKIHTVIRYQAVNLEAFFFYARATPDQLRVQLSKVLSFIGPQARSSAGTGSVADLERLAELHKAGALSDEEYAALKAKIIANFQ